jgi:hypothetical protein
VEEFFLLGCQVDEVKLIDLVLRRYHTLDVMKALSLEQFVKLVLMALEDESKEKYRAEWLSLLPCMVFTNHYMTFEQYYDTVTGKNIDLRPVDEIIAEIDRKHAEAKESKDGS